MCDTLAWKMLLVFLFLGAGSHKQLLQSFGVEEHFLTVKRASNLTLENSVQRNLLPSYSQKQTNKKPNTLQFSMKLFFKMQFQVALSLSPTVQCAYYKLFYYYFF